MVVTYMLAVPMIAANAAAPRADAPEITALVERLASDDWRARQEASDELLLVQPPGVDPLVPHLGREGLTAEQRLRLRAVTLERFIRQAHGGLGVSFATPPMAAAYDPGRPYPIVINTTEPGFDAAAKLRARDVVVSMDGQPLRNTDEMRAAILSHSPGDTVPMSVMRGGLLIDIEVKLGDFEALNNPNPLDESVLVRALELRLARAGAPLRWEIPLLGQGGQGPGDPLLSAPYSTAAVPLPGENDEFPALAVGGEARGQIPSPAAMRGSGSPNARGLTVRERQYGALSRGQLERIRDGLQAEIAELEAFAALPVNPTEEQRRRTLQVRELIVRKRAEERAIARELAVRGR